MNKRKSAKWDKTQLLDFSEEHLFYEVKQLYDARDLLAMVRRSEPDGGPYTNALLESFVIHIRGLLEFLCRPDNSKRHEDDVLAFDYMPGGVTWTPLDPSTEMDAGWIRVNKEVGHLTSERQDANAPGKQWRVDVLIAEMQQHMRTFLKMADPTKLHPKVNAVGGRLIVVRTTGIVRRKAVYLYGIEFLSPVIVGAPTRC